MRKTQVTEILRMIFSTKAFCITIIMVTALSIMCYTGISFATQSLKEDCDQFFDEHNFYDIQILSLYGFNDDTLNKMSTTSGVEDVQTEYYTQELITIDQDDYVADVYTYEGDINAPVLVSGRLPENEGECAVEQALLDRFGLNVGDKIIFPEESEMLKATELTIVGSVNLITVFATNDFYNRGTSNLGDGQVTTKIIVDESAFSDTAIRQLCYVTLKNVVNRGSDEYFTYVSGVRDELMPIVKDGGEEEYNRLLNDYQSEIDDAQKQYDQGAQEISNAKTELSNAKQQIADSKVQLEEKKQELENSKQSLEEVRSTLDYYNSQLVSARTALDDFSVQLASGKQQLDYYSAELDNVEIQLDEYQIQLADARSQLDSAKLQLDEAESQLSDQRSQFDYFDTFMNAAKQIVDRANEKLEIAKEARDKLEAQLESLEPDTEEYIETQEAFSTLDAKVTLIQKTCNLIQYVYDYLDSLYNDALSTYNSAYSQYQDGLQTYEAKEIEYSQSYETYTASLDEFQSNKAGLDSQLEQYYSSYAQYQEKEAQYNAQKQSLEESQAQYNEMLSLYNTGSSQIYDAENEIISAQNEINEKDSQLNENEQELADAAEELKAAKEELADLPLSQTFSSDINANPSYYYYTQVTDGTDLIVVSLCALMMAIAILVCFTTISRMVTEQHRIIGTQKAMGFLPIEIYRKYIAYVAFSTLLGIVIGIACSYLFVERLVYNMVYGSAFITTDFTPVIYWGKAVILAALELLIMCLSAFLACHSMLKKSAIALLNSNIRGNKGFNKAKSSRLPLSVSMILRNLKSNPQIFITTLVSVMGCTIMMISVLTIRQSMAGIAPRQFDELQNYQGTLTLDNSADEEDLDDIKEFIDSQDYVELLPVSEKFVSFKTTDATQYATLIGIDPDEDVTPFLEILDVETLERMQIPDEGVLICKKLAENNGYKIGDTFILLDSYGKEYETFVAGIFDRNIGMAIIISPDYYNNLMGTDSELYQYYVKGSDENVQQFISEAKSYMAYCSYSDAKYYQDEMNYKVSCVNKVILVVLFITGLLILFVLFNLAQMNIRKKEKDIVVMKVLGFPEKRLRGYVFWEAMIICMIGLVLGLLVGGPLGSYLTKAIEMKNLQDIRGISFIACALGCLVNFVFFTLTNLLSLRGIRKVKMTGSAREA